MLAKIPIPQAACVRVLPRDWPQDVTGYYSSADRAVVYKDGLSIGRPGQFTEKQSFIRSVSHEICHAHQHRAVIDANLGNSLNTWTSTAEGREFAAIPWDESFMGDSFGPLEDFANVCSAWYFPTYYTTMPREYADFCRKWLPK